MCFLTACFTETRFGNSKQNVIELIGLLIIFAAVIAACYFVTRFVANKQMGLKNSGNFEIVDTYGLAQNKFLQIVRIGHKYYAIAVCKENVSLISEIDEADLVFKSKAQLSGFSDVLSKIMKKDSTKESFNNESEKVDKSEED